jgi:hypothetical protein
LVDRYEELRGQALGQSVGGGPGLGLALFIRRGMAAWMGAWSNCTPQIDRRSAPDPPADRAFPMDVRSQVARVLVEMVMNTLPMGA